MSLNVLVIPEDFRKDQYVLGPLLRRLFAEIGKPHARVEICTDPVMGGISQALDWERIDEVIDMYPIVHVFLLLVDRDGKAGRRTALDGLETRAGEPSEWKWQEIRAEVNPKETYFEPLARQRGLTSEPGEGRTTMGREAAQNYARVRSLCREDIQALETRLKDWFGDD